MRAHHLLAAACFPEQTDSGGGSSSSSRQVSSSYSADLTILEFDRVQPDDLTFLETLQETGEFTRYKLKKPRYFSAPRSNPVSHARASWQPQRASVSAPSRRYKVTKNCFSSLISAEHHIGLKCHRIEARTRLIDGQILSLVGPLAVATLEAVTKF